MSVSNSFGEEGSDVSTTNDEQTARTVEQVRTCPECSGRVVSEQIERVCTECGLVVAEESLTLEPGVHARGPGSRDQSDRWAVEPTNHLRVDKGLHTTFFLQTDGYGNHLSNAQYETFARLKRRHRRFTMHDDRDKRLNEGFRDIGMLGANLWLPEFVCIQATRYLREAKEERLPGGKMAWESLAGAALLLAAREAGFERTPGEVAHYAKTERERLCAAARKLRVQTDIEVPPAYDRAVEMVVKELDEADVDLETGLELARVGAELMAVADAEPVGPGTPRLTVAGAAVYVADKRTAGKTVSQTDVVDAVEESMPSSRWKLRTYAERLEEAVTSQRLEGRVNQGPAAAD